MTSTTRFTLSVDFDLPGDWPASETTKALERIVRMAQDQLDRWEGAATTGYASILDDGGMVRVSCGTNG